METTGRGRRASFTDSFAGVRFRVWGLRFRPRVYRIVSQGSFNGYFSG